MSKATLWRLAKFLELVGMCIVLAGLVMSISLGMDEEGLKSMAYSGYGLMIGGGLFILGYFIERSVGAR